MATGVEPVGAALAVVGLIAAFNGAIDGYLLIESFFDDDDGGGYLTLRYHIEKHKLLIWGDFFRTSDPASCALASQPEVVKRLVLRILGEIKRTHEQAEPFIKKHNLVLPPVAAGDLDKGMAADSQMAKDMAKLALSRSPRSRVSWVIKRKDKFAELVLHLQQLNRDLYDVLQPADVDLLQRTLSSYVLAKIKGTGYVKMLQDPAMQSPRLLALSAQLMGLEQSAASTVKQAVTVIGSNQLALKDAGGWTTGIYTHPTGIRHPVWIEWNILDPEALSYQTLRDRAESLAVMLETVNEPALHIPPCCGIFEDSAFRAANRKTRLGTVLTVPKDSGYEGNFGKLPPTNLKELIRATRAKPPLLGDRFRLAYELASGFSLFHAAGWLHKGFRSENIVFLHRDEGRGIDVAQPLVTGFQASRSRTTESVKLNADEDPEVEYYYHEDARGGFTKKLDLYGLGVVLCEVGRWEVLADAVPSEKKPKLKSRSWARKLIINDPLEDLGWRMGSRFRSVVRTLLLLELPNDSDDFFAHEFFTKVIMPLEMCTA
ncbi:hypothetical protein GGTG_05281 [Gaeumannomyces tritici R3-111a-1]|uniref:Prion-inhibition and propagation HeLo domain-containing protein n=1 Tax=Gaeumannomyces tritici (strain R3-111a-1) TaxID=644352 RepID=J3NVG6_GAET3|nr:hypothetical protein GGTG_05281 [Gaeumannomyces tritici R3-111a-1]EJT75344.1 hypothetical protein GGTG_05281 [Gaeumannomyces tritici R3-111a-1]